MKITRKTLTLAATLGTAAALWAAPHTATASPTATTAGATTVQAWCGPGKVWDPILHMCVPY
ncbi:hypothetical protein ACFVH6_05630 [Spirillospora sp. NPDC127200]